MTPTERNTTIKMKETTTTNMRETTTITTNQ